MAFGIYKPGQGYWVRVLTAAMIGVLTLAASAWIWKEMQGLADRLPKTTYEIRVQEPVGAVQPGDRVLLTKAAESGMSGAVTELGSAEVSRYDAPSRTLWIKKIQMNASDLDPSQAKRVKAAVAGPGQEPAAFSAAVEGRPQGMPIIEPLYLQGIGAAVVLVLGVLLAFWLAGVRPGAVEFLIATDLEMKKVNWSSRKEIIGSTWVVIGATFLIAAALFVFDLGLQWFFRAIRVLEG